MKKSLPATVLLWAASALFGADPWAQVTSPGAQGADTSQVEVSCSLAPHVDAATLRVEMDGTDLTAFVTVSEGSVTIRMPGPLSDGPHELLLSGQDLGQIPLPPLRREFTVKARQRREIGASGNLGYQAAATLAHDNLPDPVDPQSGLAQGQMTMKRGAAEQELSVTTVYNTPSPPPPFQRKIDLSTASYRVKYERGPVKFNASVGQVMVDLSPLTVAGYSTRGGSFRLDASAVGLEVFSLDTRRPFGWSGQLGPGTDTEDHINGFRLTTKVLKGVELYGTYLKGAEPQAYSYNIGTEEEPTEGEVAGVGGQFAAGRWSGLAEITQGWREKVKGSNPRAYRAQLGTQRQTVSLRLSYQRIEEGYASPGVPYLPTDREEATANLQYSKGRTQAGLSLGYQHDNLSGHGWFPPLRQLRGGLSLNRGLGAAWNLNFSYNAAKQSADSGETGYGQDLMTQTASAGLSLRKGRQFLQYSLNGSMLDDRGPFNSDNRMVGQQMMYAVSAAAWLDVNASLQHNRVRPNMQADYGKQTTANLDFRTRFLKSALTVDFGGSWSHSKANDRADAAEMNALHLRLGYRPLEKVKGFSQSVLSLDLRQVRTAFAGRSESTLQILLNAALNLSGRTAHAN